MVRYGVLVEVVPKNLGHGSPAITLSLKADFTQGNGVGLATCEVIEHLGGHVWTESAAGQGTCIVFTLPEAGGGEEVQQH